MLDVSGVLSRHNTDRSPRKQRRRRRRSRARKRNRIKGLAGVEKAEGVTVCAGCSSPQRLEYFPEILHSLPMCDTLYTDGKTGAEKNESCLRKAEHLEMHAGAGCTRE